MKLEENKLYLLRENETGAENEECSFRCRFGEREAEFYFDVKDEDIISPFQKDNEDIWEGDAVEVFLSPDGRQSHYYELEVSPCGVRFWGEITVSEGERKLKKQPPPFSAEAERTDDGYRVKIVLPLAALCGSERGELRLNAFRLDRKSTGEQRLYALAPTYCPTFHRPEYFMKLQEQKQ